MSTIPDTDIHSLLTLSHPHPLPQPRSTLRPLTSCFTGDHDIQVLLDCRGGRPGGPLRRSRCERAHRRRREREVSYFRLNVEGLAAERSTCSSLLAESGVCAHLQRCTYVNWCSVHRHTQKNVLSTAQAYQNSMYTSEIPDDTDAPKISRLDVCFPDIPNTCASTETSERRQTYSEV